MKEELSPIVLGEPQSLVWDVLAGSDVTSDDYIDVSCSGVGGAACKEGCVSGCKNSVKDGVCSSSCQEGCSDGCKDSCKNGCKKDGKTGS